MIRRLRPLLLAALAAAAAPAQAVPPAAPAAPQGPPSAERELLDAFQVACWRVDDLNGMRSDAKAAGWQMLAPGGDPRIDNLEKLGREQGDDGKLSGESYWRSLGDARLFLIVSRWESPDGYWGNGCRLYHFEADEALPLPALESWMGKAPSSVQDLGPVGLKRLWEPGWRDGVLLEVTHIPADSPLGQIYGLRGNVLVAQSIGGF